MTVNAFPARNEYTASAGQTVFNFSFKIYTDQDLDVFITPVGQVANDANDLTTAYSIDSGSINNTNGGFLTLSSPVNSGDLVTIVSGMASNRTVDYQNSGDFLPDTVNDDMDRTVSLDKQTVDTSIRTPSYPKSQQNAGGIILDPPAPMKFWRDSSDGLRVEKVDLTTSGAPTNASLITYSAGNEFVGGVDRGQQDKNTDLVSVFDFGAVMDNLADDVAKIRAAVDSCIVTGHALWWPEGIANVTGNIPNFHEVTHRGPGAIRRGSNTWYVEKTATLTDRRLFVSSVSGSNSNDGLDLDFPLQYEPYAMDTMISIGHHSGEFGYVELKPDHFIVDESMMLFLNVDAGWITIVGDGDFGESGYTRDSGAAFPLSAWQYNAANHNPVPCNCTPATSSRYVKADHAIMPKLDIFVDGQGDLDRLYTGNFSDGYIGQTYGGMNFRASGQGDSRPCYNNGGSMQLVYTVWDTFDDSMYCARGGNWQMTGSLIKNGTDSSNASVVVSRTGQIEAHEIEFEDCVNCIEVKRGATFNGLDMRVRGCTGRLAIVQRCAAGSFEGSYCTDITGFGFIFNLGSQGSLGNGSLGGDVYIESGVVPTQTSPYAVQVNAGSTVGATGIQIVGNGAFADGIFCRQRSNIDANACDITGVTRNGIFCQDGSIVNIGDGSVTSSGNIDLNCSKGATIVAVLAETSSSAGSGVPVIGDTNFSAFNTIEGTDGIIYG